MADEPPFVSVVIPTFHRERTVVEAVRSALSQSGVTVEVLVLDDSAEGSAEPAVTAIGDRRVRYRRRATPTGGRPAVVRNEGLAEANAPFVHFLDDDDILEEGALAATVGALQRHPEAGVAMGVVVPFGEDARALAHERAYFADGARRLRAARSRLALVAGMLFDRTPLVNSSCTIRRACARAVGGYSAKVPIAEDVDFYLRAIRRCGFVFVDRPVVRYRTGTPSLMHSLTDHAVLIESFREIYARYRAEYGALEFNALRSLAVLRQFPRRMRALAGRIRPAGSPHVRNRSTRPEWRWAAAVLLVPVLLAGAIGVRVSKRVWSSLAPPREVVTAPTDLGPLTDVQVRALDGTVIRGWYVPSRNGAAVILGHGWGAQRSQLLPEARALAASGYGVVLFDWRGHGQSGGARTTWGVREQEDLDAVIDFVSARPEVDPRRIGAIGFSMGGMIVAQVAERDQRLRAIVLEGAYTSLEDEVRHDEGRWGWWSGTVGVWTLRRAGIHVDELRPIDYMCRISPRPLLIIDGGRDQDLPVEVAKRMYAAACEPKSLWIIPQATHRSYARSAGPEFGRRLVDFFDRALTSPSSPVSATR